jgi:signal peptidase I
MTDPQQSAATRPAEDQGADLPAQQPEGETPVPAGEQPNSPEIRRPALFGFQAMLTVLVVAIFMITFVVQAFRVPSESMENTLLIGDFVLVDKVHFGNDGNLWNRILPYRPIQRGDIIVFRYPVDPTQYFVKRVIGLPGDHIHLRSGIVFRNGEPLRESYVIHSFPYYNFYRDNFPTPLMMTSEVDHSWRRSLRDHMQGEDIVVPNDSFFVMGDNRDRSLDSRYWGFVPRGNIMGRPLIIYMSVNDGRSRALTASGDKLIHSGHSLAHFLDLARWGRVFRLVR